ncbi:MAG: MarC family protein [Nitrospiraceae bacterium]|nr:MarC family protein [Nitrospiraceae bacterium]
MELWKSFLFSFIPIMVALDAFGTLPIFVGMTEGFDQRERMTVVRQSIITAFLVTVGFVLVGRAVFTALGILVEDFMIAGGVILLIIATVDIVRPGERRNSPGATLGVVPLGTPIIAGPAVLTTTLVLQGSHGYLPVLFSLIANLLICWLVFAQSGRIIAVVGINGSRAFAKVASLILAAFAVKMIRTGVMKLIAG